MGQEGFDFLGFHFHKLKAKKSNKLLPYMWPGQKAMKAMRTKIHQITERKRLSNPLTEVVKYLNLVIRGWRNYFKCGNSTKKFQDLDRVITGHVILGASGWRITELTNQVSWRRGTGFQQMLQTR